MALPVSLVNVHSQIPNFGNVPAGSSFESGYNFLIKNITDENITLSVIPANEELEVTTVFYPGWNPEIVKKITSTITAGQLQYGY